MGVIFLSNSVLFGNWVTRIPDIKEKCGLSESELGLALLGAPVGALIIMPFTGWIIAKLQVGRTIWLSALLHAFAPAILSLSESLYGLVFGTFYFGFSNVVMDISMNAAAVVTEKKLKHHIMSSCHGMWSTGAMIGAAMGSGFLSLGINPVIHLFSVSILIILLTLSLTPHILKYHESRSAGDKVFALPNLTLLGLAIIGFCILMSEGGIADWSALYMKESLLSRPVLIGLSYANYSFLMAIGRFSGDAIIPAIGKKKVVVIGGLIAAFGLFSTILIQNEYYALLGFGLAGMGFSCVVPVIFSSAANEPGYSSGTGIAAVTSLGYMGFLAGPPIMGLVSEAFSLGAAIGLIGFLSLLVSLLGSIMRFR